MPFFNRNTVRGWKAQSSNELPCVVKIFPGIWKAKVFVSCLASMTDIFF